MNRRSKRLARFETKHWLLRKYEALADSIWRPGKEVIRDATQIVLFWALQNRIYIIKSDYSVDARPEFKRQQFSAWLLSGDTID